LIPKNNKIMTSPVIQPWQIGYKILNRYEIMDIKKGGMGVVYIVSDHDWNGRIYAAKTFQDKYIWNEEAIQRFLAEAEAWISLERHTNIVFADFVMKIEGKPFVFLDYVYGGDLNQFVGNLTIPEALDFAIQFCTGMDYAHKKLGLIHRDIKPGNVLVQKDPRFRYGYCYKITDFGLVKALGDQFEEEFIEVSTVMGSLPFMPPEQFPKTIQEKFSFQGRVTTRSDIYSFGVTLYVILTGKLPFSHIDGIFRYKQEHPIFLNPKIPENLDRLIIRCLEKNPDLRYADFKELQNDLLQIFGDLDSEVYTVVGKKEDLYGIDWSYKGLALSNLGKLQEALPCFDKALEKNPGDLIAWNNKGLVYYQLGNYQKALDCFARVLDTDPGDPYAWNNKGLALIGLGRIQEALDCHKKATEVNPGDPVAWAYKGLAYANLGNYEEADRCYDIALEMNPRDHGTWCNKGFAKGNLNKLEDAIACFNKALEINPREAPAWNYKGLAHYKLGQYPEALECYNKALVIDPAYREALKNKGSVLRHSQPQESIACFDKALDGGSNDVAAWNNKGLTCARMGNYPEALGCFNKALEADPRSCEAWNNKGLALMYSGRMPEARECFDKALGFNIRDTSAWNNKGLLYIRLGDYPKALECFDKVLDTDPRSCDAWNNKGLTYTKAGKLPEALECFNIVADINPRDVEVWNNKGAVLFNLGKKQEAITCFKYFIELAPPHYASQVEQVRKLIKKLK
jgi:tetratricopeptide (TPR) repeat protein